MMNQDAVIIFTYTDPQNFSYIEAFSGSMGVRNVTGGERVTVGAAGLWADDTTIHDFRVVQNGGTGK